MHAAYDVRPTLPLDAGPHADRTGHREARDVRNGAVGWLAEVRVVDGEARLRAIVVVERLLPVEKVEAVGEQGQLPLAAELDPVVEMAVEGDLGRRSPQEAVHGLDAAAPDRDRDLAGVVVDGVGRQLRQIPSRPRVEADPEVQAAPGVV